MSLPRRNCISGLQRTKRLLFTQQVPENHKSYTCFVIAGTFFRAVFGKSSHNKTVCVIFITFQASPSTRKPFMVSGYKRFNTTNYLDLSFFIYRKFSKTISTSIGFSLDGFPVLIFICQYTQKLIWLSLDCLHMHVLCSRVQNFVFVCCRINVIRKIFVPRSLIRLKCIAASL